MSRSPQTVQDALERLEDYHRKRGELYAKMIDDVTDERTKILLEELTHLEVRARHIVEDEQERLSAREKSFLMPGPAPAIKPDHAMDCLATAAPVFEDVLSCALNSDDALDELIDLIEDSNAADSIQQLAGNLREAERTRDRQIAKFTRDD